MSHASIVYPTKQAFQQLSDGDRGPELRNIAAGENVEVVMEEGRFLPGVVENLVGSKTGDVRVVSVTFPDAVRATYAQADCVRVNMNYF